MEIYDLWQLALLAVLLFLSGFFSASETALMSVSKIRIRHMVDEKVKGAQLLSNLVENPSRLLGAILVGNNIVNIGASALATSLSIKYFGNKGVGIATGVMTFLVLIFGEITPKSLAVEHAEKMSLRISNIIFFITIVLRPAVSVLMAITNVIIRILGGHVDTEKPFITEEELKTMVNVSHEEGVLEGEEKKMIYNVFEFGDTQVKEIMQPRINVVAADVSLSYDEIISLFRMEQFSRMPIYEETIDNIVGILYIKDLMFYETKKEEFDIYKFMREPNFTFEFKKITEVFAEMRAKRIPMSVVLDEYGGTAGIVTFEDLVEEIVGEIEDEYDAFKSEIEIIGEKEYIVDGGVRIDVVNEMMGVNIESEEFESIGGFIIGEFGEIPNVGEELEYGGVKFVIQQIGKNRIEKIKIVTG